MFSSQRKKDRRSRSARVSFETLEAKALMTGATLQQLKVALDVVEHRIATLGSSEAIVSPANGGTADVRLPLLQNREQVLSTKIHQLEVKQASAFMKTRFLAESKIAGGKAMTPADDITISDFAPIAAGSPSEIPGISGATFYYPGQIQTAYGLNTEYSLSNLASEGKGVTIAIVDAYYDSYITQDLATFSSVAGLPQMDGIGNDPTFVDHALGTTALQTVSYAGKTYKIDTAAQTGWDGEIALDVEWVHAIAPYANILLVNAASNSNTNLFNGTGSAEYYAATHPVNGAPVVAITNSYGGSESSSETTYDSNFTQPNIAYFFSTGDSGSASTYTSGGRSRSIGGVEYPSASPNVVAVGGTSLYLASAKGRYGSESAWGRNIATSSQEGSSGGVSAYESKPTFQSVLAYAKRSVPDISLVADEDTGNIVVDSDYFDPPADILPGDTYFWQYGGTSLSSPQMAAMSAIADAIRIENGKSALTSSQLLAAVYGAYSNPTKYASTFHDIKTGQTGTNVTAGVGYDLATGVGTPIAPAYISLLVSA